MSARWRKHRPRKVKRYRNPGKIFRKRVLPILVVVFIAGAVVGGGYSLYRFAFPKVMNGLGIEWPPPTPTPPTPTPKPTPTPHPMEMIELTELQKELVPHADAKYICDPFRFENRIIYAGGQDEHGPRYHTLYLYNMETRENTSIAGIEKANDDFFQPQMNEKWIVVLDQKTTGGGLIKVIDREKNQSFTAKEYYDGKPVLTLVGDRICWMERTGSGMDKIYLYELRTREAVTLDMFDKTIFGQSDVFMNRDEIVWAKYGTNAAGSEQDVQAAIAHIRLDDPVKNIDMYQPEIYVHDPKTNGKIRIWSDQNHGPNPTLYKSIGGAAPMKVDEGINGYGIGDHFIAYSKGEIIYVTGWGSRDYTRQISLNGERCIFAGVSDNTVFWYVTGISDRDILKFAEIQ